MTYRKNPFLDREHPAHLRFDIHEQTWEPYLCPLCNRWVEDEDTIKNFFLEEMVCIGCDATWEAEHCVQCGVEMPVDAMGLKEGEICDVCAEEEGV